MRQRFFGVNIEVPEDWANQSALLFISPARPSADIPTTNPQDPLAQMSVTMGASAPAQGSAEEELTLRLEHMKKELRNVAIDGRDAWTTEAGSYALASCTVSDEMKVGQVIGVLVSAGRAHTFVGTSPHELFTTTQPQLEAIFRSLTPSAP